MSQIKSAVVKTISATQKIVSAIAQSISVAVESALSHIQEFFPTLANCL